MNSSALLDTGVDSEGKPVSMKYVALLFFTLFVASLASARPSNEILRKIESTYRPEISFSVRGEEVIGFKDPWNCRARSVEIIGYDPVTSKPRSIFVRDYRPGYADPLEELRTVIIQPPTGGGNKLDLGMANGLCFVGFRAVVVERWDDYNEFDLSLNVHDRVSLRELAEIRHVVEYVKPTRVNQLGLIGTSRGAISSAVALNYDSRISAGALIVGGGRLAEIISSSREETMTKLRTARMKRFGFKNEAAYLAALKKHISYEPLDFIDMAPEKPVWLMVAVGDFNVPTIYQQELAAAFGARAELHTTKGDHLDAILHTFMQNGKDIIGFFMRKLE